MLTADHVVNISHADLDTEWFGSPSLAASIAALLNAHASCLQLGGTVTADDILNGFVQFEGIPYSTQYSEPTYRVWMDTSYSGTISSTTSDSFLTSLLSATSLTATLERSSTFENDDVAILHVAATDTPFIPLGDSGDVSAQDHLTVIGFPGNADFFHPDGTYDPTDLLTPSLNTLYVSAIKSGVTGDTLLQVGGNIEHGDSGGPALNAAGQLVGVVSYSGTDTPVGTFFLRTSGDVMALVKQAGLNLQSGQFQALWTQAFDDYASSAAGHWHTAARELTSLQTNYPAFRGVMPYRDYATQAAGTEQASSTNMNRILALGIIAIAALLILALILVLILVLRKGRKPPAYATYPSYSPYSQGGPPGGPLAPPFTPMQMPTSAELVNLTRLPNGLQSSPSPSIPLSGGGSGEAPMPTSVGVGTARAPQAAPSFPGQYAPQPYSAPVTSASGGLLRTPPVTYGALGAPAESTIPLQLQRPTATGLCVNGHSMPPNEVYCGICGAPRSAGGTGH